MNTANVCGQDLGEMLDIYVIKPALVKDRQLQRNELLIIGNPDCWGCVVIKDFDISTIASFVFQIKT